MAELTYNDVRRAAQDAMRDLQNVVYGLQNSHNDLKRTVQQSGQYQLSDILSKLNAVHQQINSLSAAVRNVSSQPAAIHYNIQQNVSDIHRRLSRVEQLVELVYHYFETLHKEEDEDFKSA